MSNREKYEAAFMEVFEIGKDQLTSSLEYQSITAWDSVGHMALVAALEFCYGLRRAPLAPRANCVRMAPAAPISSADLLTTLASFLTVLTRVANRRLERDSLRLISAGETLHISIVEAVPPRQSLKRRVRHEDR